MYHASSGSLIHNQAKSWEIRNLENCGETAYDIFSTIVATVVWCDARTCFRYMRSRNVQGIGIATCREIVARLGPSDDEFLLVVALFFWSVGRWNLGTHQHHYLIKVFQQHYKYSTNKDNEGQRRGGKESITSAKAVNFRRHFGLRARGGRSGCILSARGPQGDARVLQVHFRFEKYANLWIQRRLGPGRVRLAHGRTRFVCDSVRCRLIVTIWVGCYQLKCNCRCQSTWNNITRCFGSSACSSTTHLPTNWSNYERFMSIKSLSTAKWTVDLLTETWKTRHGRGAGETRGTSNGNAEREIDRAVILVCEQSQEMLTNKQSSHFLI